ncbi:MAG: class I SAM-dependent methyltransferase [Promethearchaeota archaeon]|jgi:ubiquinone/menaquinone biosynthesis C-methylase UbiE
MTKHNKLTEKEFLKYTPHKRIINYLDIYRKKTKLDRSDINVIDWGCGRGKDVLWLREHGYNAYGVDIDPEPIQNSRKLFIKKGYDDSLLSLINGKGRTNFPDRFFHFSFSTQVFEHVNNLELVASEIGRITSKDGVGFHIFTAHRYIREEHLFMPFIHWLPKNKLRKYIILIYVLCGQEPKWVELKVSSIKAKTEAYFRYSINKTFYRKYSDIEKIFKKKGFKVSFETINHPNVKNSKLIRMFKNFKFSKTIINYFLLTFTRVELLITKIEA